MARIIVVPALCQEAGIQFIPAQVDHIDPVERKIRSGETSWIYEKISGFEAHEYSLETFDMVLH